VPTPFSTTTRALAGDRPAYAAVAWGLGALMLALWGAWFLGTEVPVFETSRAARLEVKQLPHHVASLFSGRVLAAPPGLGQAVAAGEVLLALDTTADRLRLAEEEARLAGLPPRIEALRQELVSLEAAKAEDQRAAQAAMEAARARGREAEAAARFARANEQRLREQSAAGGVAQIDALRAKAESEKLDAARDAVAADLRRLDLDRQVRAHQDQARIETLRGAALALEADTATARASVARLLDAIERHTLRAPVAGRIGDAAPLYPGAYVTEGQRLVSVVPPGELVIVADFAPSAAMGRIRPGQVGRMRLDGFPWAQFGAIDAVVTRVGSEIRDGHVRVEFQPAAGASAALMQHGVPGAIEVAVERASPAALVLRAAGLVLAGRDR
jgi:membrane fusion protein (multidrug efflux system)